MQVGDQPLREQLRAELNFYKSALDAHAIVAMTDRRGRITYANDRFCEISGYTRDELIGCDHRILNSRHHAKSFFVEMYAAISCGRVWRGDIRNRAKNGTFYWVDTTIVPMLDDKGRICAYVAIRQDITARKNAEQELLAAKEAAEAANRAKDEFLANISHEIRTPLTAILGFTDLLADPQLRADERREHVETIRRNGEHLLSLINNLLDMSKIEAQRMQVEMMLVPLERVVSDVMSMMRPSAEMRGIELSVMHDEQLPVFILTDPLRLRQVLINLLSNAIKFTQRGSVSLHVSASQGVNDTVDLCFQVRDTGIGIPPEKLSMLFKRFSQADSSTTRRFGGTGIGLYLSDRLARMLGGAIEVESTPGLGSIFTLHLSDVASREVEEPGRAAWVMPGRNESAPASLAGLHVLLAEDGPDNQRLFTHWLTRAGATVTTVCDGRAAADALLDTRAGRKPFHLVLMDMQMPVMDGYEATRVVRAAGISVPVLALTAHASGGDREKCLAAGCNGYLAKPVHRERFIENCAMHARYAAAA